MEHLRQCLVHGSEGEPPEVLWRLSDAEVRRLVRGLDEHMNRTHAWLIHAVAEADARGLPRRANLTPRQWVRTVLASTKRRACRLVRAARSLQHMPNVSKGMLAGEIGPVSASVLASAQARHPEAFSIHEETFASSARDLDPHQLRKAVEHWRQQVDHHGALHDVATRRDRRRMSLHQTFDSMWHHDADYDPESGHVISTAVRAHADLGNLDPDDRRTHPQRMVDALTDVCRFYLDHSDTIPTSGGDKPHITVMIDYHTLASSDPGSAHRLPDIDDTPVDPEVIRRLACDAGIVRVITDGESQLLDVGRRVRTVTPAIRRALDLRDGGCRWSGCDAPAGWTDAHHLVHWAHGGPTSLDNMVLLCRRHHTAVHEGCSGGLPPEMVERARDGDGDPP